LHTSSEKKIQRTLFSEQNVNILEEWIDDIDSKLPPLKNFILPGGGPGATQLHVCRTVCRRAERKMVSCVHEDEMDPILLKYMNRLSDFLFVAARFMAMMCPEEEIIYKKIVH